MAGINSFAESVRNSKLEGRNIYSENQDIKYSPETLFRNEIDTPEKIEPTH